MENLAAPGRVHSSPMRLCDHIPTLFATLALLLGTVLPGAGNAVICIAEDHVSVETGSAGDSGHCGEEDQGHDEGGSLHPVPPSCVDLAFAGVQLDIPIRGLDAAPQAPAPAIVSADGFRPTGPRLSDGLAAWSARPPPDLTSVRLTVLRL